MDEFVAKKLGEVHAFVCLVIDTYERGAAGFGAALTPEAISKTNNTLDELKSRIEHIADQEHVRAAVLAKSDKTLAKITRARDDYVAERWDDTVELYEWFSFNAGAGAAHAHEVFGAGQALKHDALTSVTRDARNYFDSLLADSKDYLYYVGSSHASTL